MIESLAHDLNISTTVLFTIQYLVLGITIVLHWLKKINLEGPGRVMLMILLIPKLGTDAFYTIVIITTPFVLLLLIGFVLYILSILVLGKED